MTWLSTSCEIDPVILNINSQAYIIIVALFDSWGQLVSVGENDLKLFQK